MVLQGADSGVLIEWNGTWVLSNAHVVGDQGVCGRFSSSFFGIMLPRAAYAEANKVAHAIIEELDLFKIVKKPSDQLVGHIQVAFGGSCLRVGSNPRDLVALALAQAQQARLNDRSAVKFDLKPHPEGEARSAPAR